MADPTLQSPAQAPMRNGGQILMQQLRVQGAKRLFMVPGESYLPCIDALNEHVGSIQAVVCRNEGGAAFMAEAQGKLSGEPGICFVTRGPGATNASIGVHTAFQDSTPMILFIGQVSTDMPDREAFQEIDYRRMFGQMAKWVAQIDRTERIAEYVARAFHVAVNGRPGPVVLALPEDVLWGRACVPDLPRYQRVVTLPSQAQAIAVAQRLHSAKRPLVIVGGSVWDDAGYAALHVFAKAWQLPVGVAWRRLDCFDHSHESYVGHVGYGMHAALAARIKQADLILAIGTRLGEATTEGFTHIQSPLPTQALLHVYPDAAELGRVFQAELMIQCSPSEFAKAMAVQQAPTAPVWASATQQDRANYLATLGVVDMPGNMNLNEAARQVAALLPADAILTVGAGNYALYPHRFIQFTQRHTQLSPTVGSMGYGLPAAIAAKLEHSDRTVVCYAGDGCFQMNLPELGVAMQYRVGIVILVFNNGMWGTIRMHQEREFPGRAIALDFDNPDFVQLARAYGGHGEMVERTEDFAAAFTRARKFADEQHMPALLEVRYDRDAIAPGTTLSEVRATALAAQSQQ